MELLKDRIFKVMKVTEWNPTRLAKEAGVSKSSVTFWKTGATAVLKAETAQALSKKSGFATDWLISGKGPMMSVELVAHGQAQPSSIATLTIDSLESHLKAVSGYLKLLDDGARRRAGSLLADLAVSPDDYAEIAGMIQESVNRANGAVAQHLAVNSTNSNGL